MRICERVKSACRITPLQSREMMISLIGCLEIELRWSQSTREESLAIFEIMNPKSKSQKDIRKRLQQQHWKSLYDTLPPYLPNDANGHPNFQHHHSQSQLKMELGGDMTVVINIITTDTPTEISSSMLTASNVYNTFGGSQAPTSTGMLCIFRENVKASELYDRNNETCKMIARVLTS